jgi:hypothetical protein
MFGRYEQKLVFLRFMSVFLSYCLRFSGSRAIYMFERNDQKLVVVACYGRFNELLPTVLGFQGDLHVSTL